MAVDADTLARALVATLSNSDRERAAAEALLARCVPYPNHAATLLRLSAHPDPVIAPAAALRLKNLVRSNRLRSGLSEQARATLRENLLDALAVVRATNIEGVLAETTHWLIIIDFPSRWPLLPSITQFLSSGDSARVHAALIALRQLVKCYEFKSRDPSKLDVKDPNDAGLEHPRQPIESIAITLFPTLLALYNHLDAIIAKSSLQTDDTKHASLAQRLVVKIFWSCTQFMLPPVLEQPSVLADWMNAFFETLRRPCIHPHIQDPDDLIHQPEEKTKKWIAQIIVRFLKRYGSPKRVPIDEPWSKKVAENFRDHHAERATKVMVQVLFSETNGFQLSRRVAHLALDFIEEAIETASLWAVLYPHVHHLLTGVVFPYLCFTEADEEMWLSDPSEYVRKQYDFTEDFTSPRMAASNLLSKMADLRSRKTVLPFLEYIHSTILAPYLEAPPNSQQRAALARQKIGVFSSLAAVKGKLMSKPDLASTFLMIMKTHVHPDLRSEFSFLRSESAWLLGQVASTEWKEFSKELGEASLKGCVELLMDSELPVQAAAAGALQFLMDQDGPGELIRASAPRLMQKLLELMDNMSDGYLSLIPSLEKLVLGYPEEIMPLSLSLIQRLMAAFSQSAESILTDGDDDDDDLAFTAAQVLHLISTVVAAFGEWTTRSAQERRDLLMSIEKELEPLLCSMFEESHQVFLEELLDVLGVLIVQIGDHNDALTPILRNIMMRMSQAFNNWAGDYVEHMMEAIEGFLLFDMPTIAQMNGGVEIFLRIIRQLWSPAFDIGDAVLGTKIAEFLILNLEKVTPRQDQLLQYVGVELGKAAIDRYMRAKDEELKLPQLLFAVVTLCLYIDAENVVKTLGVQSTLQLIGAQTRKLESFERIYTKKAIILGLGAMLQTNGMIGDEQKAHIVHIAVCLQQMIDSQRAITAANAARAGTSFAALAKASDRFGGYNGNADETGSDLEDDEDATNLLDDTPEKPSNDMEKLATETGLSVFQLEQFGNSNGVIDIDIFHMDDNPDLEDEGGFKPHPIDNINESKYLIEKVVQSGFETWWKHLNEQDKEWMQQLAKRLQRADVLVLGWGKEELVVRIYTRYVRLQ